VDRVEIRVILDSIDPPAGRLRVTSGAGHTLHLARLNGQALVLVL
jgi:hypothetical protein